MKKALVLVLSLMFLSTVLPVSLAAEEVPTITWLWSQDNNVPDENEITEELGRILGIHLITQNINRSDYNTKLNALIAADTLPDVFAVDGQTALDLRDAGKLTDLTAYIAEFGQDILAAYEEAGLDIHDRCVNTADAIYGLGGVNGGYVSNFHIRKDWLANLNMAVPTTVDELYNVLYAFTFNDPDQNGINDTYGFTAQVNTDKTWEHIFAIWGIPFAQNVFAQDGSVVRYIKHPNYLKAVEFLRKLYQDGIMNPDFAVTTWVEYAEMLWNGEIGIFDFQSVGPANNWYPARYTIALPGDSVDDLFTFANILNPDTNLPTGGVRVYPNMNSSIVVSAACAAPEKVVELINYMAFTEEGQNLTYLGIEGVFYQWIDKENGKYERLGSYKDDMYHRSAGAFVYALNGTRSNAETRSMNALTQQSQAYESSIATDYAYIGATLPVWSEYSTALRSLEMEMLCNMIVSDEPLEEMYEEYVQQWNEEGGLEAEAEATAYFEK